MFYAVYNQTTCLFQQRNCLPVHVGLDRFYCILLYFHSSALNLLIHAFISF